MFNFCGNHWTFHIHTKCSHCPQVLPCEGERPHEVPLSYLQNLSNSTKTIWLPCWVKVQVIKQFLFSLNCRFHNGIFHVAPNQDELIGYTVCFILFCFSNMRKILSTLFCSTSGKHIPSSTLKAFESPLFLSTLDRLIAETWNGAWKYFSTRTRAFTWQKNSRLVSKVVSFGKLSVCIHERGKLHSCDNYSYQQNWTRM